MWFKLFVTGSTSSLVCPPSSGSLDVNVLEGLYESVRTVGNIMFHIPETSIPKLVTDSELTAYYYLVSERERPGSAILLEIPGRVDCLRSVSDLGWKNRGP